MAADVRFLKSAVDDVARYEAWRENQHQDWDPIAEALFEAISQAVGRFDSFDRIPAPLLAVKGEVAQIKRVMVPVRSKVFRVYVGEGRRAGVIRIRRVLHPLQEPLER